MDCKKHLYLSCSINICGLSQCSQFMLNKFIYDSNIKILAVQETGTYDDKKLDLLNMHCYKDTNEAKNRGCAIYISKDLKSTPLPQIGACSNAVDSAWSLVVLNGIRLIVGSLYVKLNDNEAMAEALKLLNHANNLTSTTCAKGILVFGDFDARHALWGDNCSNIYRKQLISR